MPFWTLLFPLIPQPPFPCVPFFVPQTLKKKPALLSGLSRRYGMVRCVCACVCVLSVCVRVSVYAVFVCVVSVCAPVYLCVCSVCVSPLSVVGDSNFFCHPLFPKPWGKLYITVSFFWTEVLSNNISILVVVKMQLKASRVSIIDQKIQHIHAYLIV